MRSRNANGLASNVLLSGDWQLSSGVLIHARLIDADFVVSELGGLKDRLTEAGYSARLLANPDGSPYLLTGTTPDGMHLDIYVASTDFENSVLKRNRHSYASAEDTNFYKLVAWRPQDRDDIRSILASNRDLDTKYIADYAGEWDVTDRWNEALSQWLYDNDAIGDK